MKHAKKSQIAAPITVQSLVQIEGLTAEEFAGTKTLQDVTTLGLVHMGMLKQYAAQKSVKVEGANQLQTIVMDQPKPVGKEHHAGTQRHAVWVYNVMGGNVLMKTRKKKLPMDRLAWGEDRIVQERKDKIVAVGQKTVLGTNARRMQMRLTMKKMCNVKTEMTARKCLENQNV